MLPTNENLIKISKIEIRNKKEKSVLKEKSSVKTEPWLIKYTPKSFTELVSDDKMNREVLKWLKSWNEYVYRPKQKLISNASAKKIINQNQYKRKLETPNKTKLSNNKKNSTPKSRNPSRQNSITNKKSNNYKISDFITAEKKESEVISVEAPGQRFILISGSSGIGKTALAMVVTKICGYYPYKFDMSDVTAAELESHFVHL